MDKKHCIHAPRNRRRRMRGRRGGRDFVMSTEEIRLINEQLNGLVKRLIKRSRKGPTVRRYRVCPHCKARVAIDRSVSNP